MLVNDKQALARLNSPINLINKMRGSSSSTNQSSRAGAMGLFGVGRQEQKKAQEKEEPKTVSEKEQEKELKPSFNPFEKKKTQESQGLVLATQQIIQSPKLMNTNAIIKEEPGINDLIDNSDSQVKLAAAHDKALDILTSSIDLLGTKLDDIKPEKLAGVITAASKVVEGIRKERNEAARTGKGKEVHYHFYTPEQRKIDTYEVIEVS